MPHASSPFPHIEARPVAWTRSDAPVAYEAAVAFMEARVQEIIAQRSGEMVWLLEHPPIYTAGVSAKAADLLHPDRFPVHRTGRGGQFTYHGPGQRVAYVMLDLRKRKCDAHAFVQALETWLIAALGDLGVTGETRCGRVGVWVAGTEGENKIAAIGVKLRRWVSFHGISLNVSPDLSHFDGIIPCGISQFGVTSLKALGAAADQATVDAGLRAAFEGMFGLTIDAPSPDLG